MTNAAGERVERIERDMSMVLMYEAGRLPQLRTTLAAAIGAAANPVQAALAWSEEPGGQRRFTITHPTWCVPAECEFDPGVVEGCHVGPAVVLGTADGTGAVTARLAQLLAEDATDPVEVRLEVTERTLPGAATVPSGLACGPVVDVSITADLSLPQARELAELLLEYAAAAERFVYGGS